jgi:hypothetical protein
MKPPDEFGSYYGSLIEASYDCVDRLTINAYFPLGQTGGGFRCWWRQWQGGEQRLNDAGLKAAAGDLARRLKAWCLREQIPWIECKAHEAKYVLARELRPKDPNFRGVFAVLVGRAPAPVWEVRHNQAGKITELRHPETWPHVQHYYFQIQDPQWGHVVVRLCGYPPWGAQVILNGHERVERAACRAGVSLSKAGNCFVEGTDYGAVNGLAELLTEAQMPQELQALCERWLYSSCLCFGLPVAEQESSGFRYRYSVWQQEYSRNFLFREAAVLEEVFQKLLDRTREPLDIKVLETIFGRRHRQPKRNKQRAGRAAVEVSKEVDQREWDTTVFRVRWGNLLLKIYDKSGRVLRVEVVVQNTKDLGCGKGLDKLPEQWAKMQELLVRFLANVVAAHLGFLDQGQFEAWHQPTQRGQRRLAGINLNNARNRTVVEAVTGLSTVPEGFTMEQLAEGVRARTHWSAEQYSVRRAAYDLAKLRGKEVVEKRPGTRRYQCQADKLSALCAYVVVREKVLKPLMAGAAQGPAAAPPKRLSPLDQHYLALQANMKCLFGTLGLKPNPSAN